MLLGMKVIILKNERSDILDKAWSLMEIMGVGMVDMKIWKWCMRILRATPAKLKGRVVNIATDTWNEFLAPVIGVA
jgi:hypothetical protein